MSDARKTPTGSRATPSEQLEELLGSVPRFKVTTRLQGRSERGNTDTLYGIRTAGELSREISRRLNRSPK